MKNIYSGTKPIKKLLSVLFLLASALWSHGQMGQLETDQGIDASIAPYDADVRQAILLASQYPQTLSQLQKSQDQTVASFHDVIGGFDRKKQGWFYTLTRYPNVMHALATLPKKQGKEAVYLLLPNKDAELREAAWKLYKSNQKDLERLDNINIAAGQDFTSAIQSLDGPAKAAFQKLSTMPDVLTLLTNNIELTTKLGEHYKNDPTTLNERLASIHDSLNVQDQYETESFKKQMAGDPQAVNEYSQAAKDYAKENGYDVPTEQPAAPDEGNYYADPYSYWFGYPDWYPYPLWYPGSFWFDTGFYYGPGGFGLWGMPGYGFSTWFFNAGHYNRYPNLYRQFGNYYRNNIAENRVMGPANHGFMGVANSHFNANGGNRLNRLTSPGSYRRANGQLSQPNRLNPARVNANSYHGQSWRSFGGRDNSVRFNGGGSRGGGGRRH